MLSRLTQTIAHYNVIYIKMALESSSKPRNCANSASRSTTLRASEDDLMTGSLRDLSNSSSSFSSLLSSVIWHSFFGSSADGSQYSVLVRRFLNNLGSDVFAPSWCVTANVLCKLISLVIYCRILNTFFQTICHLSA